jgi:predicted O-methyltransferase YrrM
MLKSFLKDLLDPFCFAISKRRLRKLERSLKTPSTRLAIPFIYKGEGHYRRIAPIQSHEEIAALYREVCALKPKVVLEIGTCHGGSLYLWCQVADPNATLISLDLPGGKFGGGYHDKRTKLYQCFSAPGQKLHLLRDDSHRQESLLKVQKILNGQKVDFLFIDGDHCYEGVKRDYEQYSALVRTGGIIAFHDIFVSPGALDLGMEVWRFWEELKKKDRSACEFLNTSSNDRSIGIGLLRRS